MGRELTAADMADYFVEFGVQGMAGRTIPAAYVTAGDAGSVMPQFGNFVHFKDWRHKTTAMVQASAITLIERREAPASADQATWHPDVDKIALQATATMTPGAIRDFQDDLNAAAAKHGYRQRFLLMPAGSRDPRSLPVLPVPAGR